MSQDDVKTLVPPIWVEVRSAASASGVDPLDSIEENMDRKSWFVAKASLTIQADPWNPEDQGARPAQAPHGNTPGEGGSCRVASAAAVAALLRAMADIQLEIAPSEPDGICRSSHARLKRLALLRLASDVTTNPEAFEGLLYSVHESIPF